ncbi:hypothetical protein GBF38_020563 [Nibea albiflora]|uniref:Uncharacterized protein n=1 Tax=Nibea albiflora TaxID=240163 RepID=A0ACB7FFR7_NIBAL|nr:hypothetical protein GBF38_020563 [Nibea albiflora]
MAEQGKMVMSAVGATGSGNTLQQQLYKASCGEMSYSSNQRLAIHYKPSLDRIDNPQFGLLLSDSYTSQTKRHYQPHIRSDCPPLNIVNKPRESGFHQLRSHPKAVTEEEQGTEARPNLCSHSSRETGFTRGAIALLACPTSLVPSTRTKTNASTEKAIGKKESTGFLLNASNSQAFPNTPFDRSHFTTHYKSMFRHRADYDKLKNSGAVTKMDSGYNRRDMDR